VVHWAGDLVKGRLAAGGNNCTGLHASADDFNI